MDTFLLLSIFIQFIIALLGVLMTLYEEKAIRYKKPILLTFIVLGLSGMILTVIQSTHSSKENIGYQTGGDSFCYLDFLPSNNNDRFLVIAVHSGIYPLRDVKVRMLDLNRFKTFCASNKNKDYSYDDFMALHTIFDIKSIPPNSVVRMAKIDSSDKKLRSFNIFFSGLNGFWDEQVRLIFVDGNWVHAIRVRKEINNKSKILYENIDSNYPVISGKAF